MKQIEFKDKHYIELHSFYLSYLEVMKAQGVESFNHFVENMAVHGLRQFQNNYRPPTPKVINDEM